MIELSETTLRPSFIGKAWLAPSQGFSYLEELPPGITGRQHKNEWLTFISIVEKLKVGDFRACKYLADLTKKTTHLEIKFLALRIIGYCFTQDNFITLCGFFMHPVREIRIAAYESALYSCTTDFIEPLLLALMNKDFDEKLEIMSSISHLLEKEPDELYDDAEKISHKEYINTALLKKKVFDNNFGVDVPIFESAPHNIFYLIERIEYLCESEDFQEFGGIISMYFDLFEAMTGWPTVGVFDSSINVNKEFTLNLISSIRRSGILDKFKIGKRYFFGNELPSW
jgi:hypothetical protein